LECRSGGAFEVCLGGAFECLGGAFECLGGAFEVCLGGAFEVCFEGAFDCPFGAGLREARFGCFDGRA